MSKEQKNTDNEQTHKPSNIEDFVCNMLERLNVALKNLNESVENKELELPDAIGPETEDVLNQIKHDEPITKIRKVIVIPGRDKDKVEEILGKLMSAREADINNGLRQVFAQVHKVKTNGGVAHQIQAIKSLDSLIREASGSTKDELIKARQLVLSGENSQLDAANFRLRNIFASRVDSNVRLAYTSLSTQFGEGYQLCPKSMHQIGKVIPMEVSKCRDNCIDCRVTRDGAVSCAYAEWLRKSADNHNLVDGRLEKVKHNLNSNLLGKLDQPDSHKGWEGQLDDIREKYPVAEESSIEQTLDNRDKSMFGHQGEAIKRIQEFLNKNSDDASKTNEESLETDRTNDDYDDATLEEMLEDEREPFNEQELEMMIEELLDEARNKE